MIIQLTGVLQDGSARSDRTPLNPRALVVTQLGTDIVVQLTVVNSGNQPVDMTGVTTTLTIRRRPGDAPVVQKVGVPQPSQGPGRSDITIPAVDSRNKFEAGRYLYDIAFDKGGKRDVVLPMSPWLWEPNIT